jgi:hypothetical protein
MAGRGGEKVQVREFGAFVLGFSERFCRLARWMVMELCAKDAEMIKQMLVASCLCLGACGPLVLPMVHRLNKDEQEKVDQVWVNMLNRPKPLDRQVLLDAVSMYYLYGTGVERATYHAEKQVGEELVVMEVNFDQRRPGRDSFSIAIFGPDGRTIRQETYSRAEVEEALGPGLIATHIPATQPSATQPVTAEEEAEQLRMQWRLAAVAAATQPATTRGQ